MTLSELIEQLQGHLDEHGDIDVVFPAKAIPDYPLETIPKTVLVVNSVMHAKRDEPLFVLIAGEDNAEGLDSW